MSEFTRSGVTVGADGESAGVSDLGGNLIVVSNRQPYRHRYTGTENGTVIDRPTGGLTAGLDPVVQHMEGTWIAWGDGEADFAVTEEDGTVEVPPDDPSYTLKRVRLTDTEVDNYYRGYANQVLWPLCHSMTDKVQVTGKYWETYRRVNEKFAGAAAEYADDETTIWFQDYHLGLAPWMTRSRTASDVFLMQFWHIPWPSPDVYRVCPHGRELLSGLLGNDYLGFHVSRYCENFLACADEFLKDTTVDRGSNRIFYNGTTTTVAPTPLGVDTEDIPDNARSADGTFWSEFRHDHGIAEETAIALGVDRLDYTKGIPRRLTALEHLWETRPEWRGDLTYVQKGAESRTGIPAYRQLQKDVEAAVERINDRFSTDSWQPVVYTTEKYPRQDLASLYYHADLALVTPLRDGMNLVCQEYVAAQVDNEGVLILSELAGASEELGDQSLTVNPYDPEGVAAAIDAGLTKGRDERQARMRRLRQQVYDRDIGNWFDEVFRVAGAIRTEKRSVNSGPSEG